jgi:hypothetical protein
MAEDVNDKPRPVSMQASTRRGWSLGDGGEGGSVELEIQRAMVRWEPELGAQVRSGGDEAAAAVAGVEREGLF